MRRMSCLILLVWMTCFALGANDVDVEIVDQTGVMVSIDQPVEHLVSIYGIGTYYVYALGARDQLALAGYIGLKQFAQATEMMKRFEPRLESLLTAGDPSVEEMISLEADLILVDGSRHGAFADQMTDLGVPVVQYLVEDPDAMIGAIRMTGTALGGEAITRAEAYINDLSRVIGAIGTDLADLTPADRPRVLFIGTTPLTVASGTMFQTRWIELAGGVSVARDLWGSWNEVNIEQILIWDPEVVVIAPYGPVKASDLLENPDWQTIRAVRNGRVVRMPRILGPMDTPVPESLIGLLWLAETLHPNRLSLDLRDEITRFYTDYYEFELTAEELGSLLP